MTYNMDRNVIIGVKLRYKTRKKIYSHFVNNTNYNLLQK